MTYSHDSVGLGHLRRSVSIAAEAVRRGPNISALCVTGSPTPDVFTLPERCDVIKMPSISKSPDGQYVSRRLPLPLRDIVKVRSDMIVSALRTYRPHVLLVDHTPTGPGDELIPALRRIRRESGRTRTVLGLRDIIDAPERVRNSAGAVSFKAALDDLYDDVLVYGDPSILDVSEYGWSAATCARAQYVGIVCPPRSGSLRRADGLRPHLVATAGGGEDGYELLRAFIGALRGPLRERSLRASIVAGPMMPTEQVGQLGRALQGDPRIQLQHSTRDVAHLLDTADLVVSMGGYNSVYEALSRGLPLLTFPRTKPRREQIERCARLEARGLLRVLDKRGNSHPDLFAAAIDQALAQPQPPRATLRFDGVETAVDCLLDSSGRELPQLASSQHRHA